MQKLKAPIQIKFSCGGENNTFVSTQISKMHSMRVAQDSQSLTTTGFMHNRVRMLVASFFTKDLLYDWRIGERFFANNLYDYDPTQNNCDWQVVAGFGPSALDWFRVMNPWLQTEKFDPDCTYIKKWVPELSKYTAKQIIIQEWDAKDYPRPIINHEDAKKKMMAAYKNV